MPSVKSGDRVPLIQIRNLSFQYRDTPSLALKGVTFDVFAGDRVLVIGHNGSGKSTLLSLLAGQRKRKDTHAGEASVLRVMERDPFDDTSMARHITRVGPPWPPESGFAVTIDRVASPAPDEARKAHISSLLHLRLSRYVDRLSSGEKRRVQILHAFLYPATVFLLDECSTDIDVAERQAVLRLVREECEARDGCCLYATHIFEKIEDNGWATHVLFMRDGEAVAYSPIEAVLAQHRSVEAYAYACMSTVADPDRVLQIAEDTAEVRKQYERVVSANASFYAAGAAGEREEIITCRDLSFRDVFRDLSFSVFRGERCLLCGCNGSGKSTLLNMLGGKQFFNNTGQALRVLGKVCYDDMTLNGLVAYGGDWWAVPPVGEIYVREMLAVRTERAAYLRDILAVDLDWDVRRLSSGEQKRVQLLFHLLEDKPVVLLDEATADLDVDQRHRLLRFLYQESVYRGVTVIYSTHIFGGLQGWATTFVILDRMKRGVHAVWRASEGHTLSLDALTSELIDLKSREIF